ncbi:MAG: hypothetical protein ACETWE_02985 [Candidatus Bathyarchaeia archaeon]
MLIQSLGSVGAFGLLIRLFNFMSLFIMRGYAVWNLILHAPLIFTSMCGLLIAKRLRKSTFSDLNC